MARTLQFIAGITILIGMEILRVYFIMPFPGSQRAKTIELAYFIHNNSIYFRIIGLLMIAFPVFQCFRFGSRKAKGGVAISLAVFGLVFYFFNFRFMADKMFYQPEHKIFADTLSNNIPAKNLVLGVNINGESKGSFCYGELAARFPEAGGGYVYLREAYGRELAFLYGWKCFFVMDPGITAALAGGMVAAFFSFGGWWDASKLAGEVRDPGRILPRALASGVAIVTLVYILTSAAFFYLVPLEQVTSGETFAAQAGEALFGRAGGKVFAGIVVISVLSSLAGLIMAAPHVYIALTVAAVNVLRRKPTNGMSYKTPGYPVTPLLFLALVAVLLLLLAANNPKQAFLGAGVVALGWPVYRLVFRKQA